MRRRSVQRLEDVRKHRSSELYVTFKDLRRRFEKEAEQQNKEMTKEWQKQGEFRLARLPENIFTTHSFFCDFRRESEALGRAAARNGAQSSQGVRRVQTLARRHDALRREGDGCAQQDPGAATQHQGSAEVQLKMRLLCMFVLK